LAKSGALHENDSLEIVYRTVVKRFELEIDRKKELDNKANNLVGFIGIIMSLITGFSVAYIKVPTIEEWNLGALRLLSPIISLGLVFIFILASFLFVLKVIQIKEFTYVPNAFTLVGAYSNSEKQVVLRDLCDDYAIAIGDNHTINDKKANDIKNAIWSLSLGFFALILHTFLLLI